MSKQRKASIFSPESGTVPTPPDAPSHTAFATTALNLTDHFLIAMPSMRDPVFDGSVVYLCEHNKSGALGMIINKATNITMENLLARVDLKKDDAPVLPEQQSMVLYGGPVQDDRGFVLHAPAGNFSSTMRISSDVSLTTSRDILEAVACREAPPQMLVTLGCSGWSAGQLEDEIVRNGWLTVPADPVILFELPLGQRFTAALALLGVEASMLSVQVGHA